MIIVKTITRPSNTTAYASGDVMTDTTLVAPIELDCPIGQPTIINSTIVSSNPASTPTINLNFYSSTFTVAADNAAFVPTAANQITFLGKITHSTWAATTYEKTSTNEITKPIGVIASESTYKLYLVITLGGAYTPTSAETITIKLDLA